MISAEAAALWPAGATPETFLVRRSTARHEGEEPWDEEGGSIHSLLRTQGLFHVSEIRKAPLDKIESRLRKCESKGGLPLHTDGGRTRFAKTIKELSLHVGRIASSMKSAATESDLISLHEDMMNIHGFSASISARCIAYAMRELGAGRTSPEMFGRNELISSSQPFAPMPTPTRQPHAARLVAAPGVAHSLPYQLEW